MGCFGTGIYDDDCACDIRDLFCDLLCDGKKSEEIVERIEKEYAEVFLDKEDGPIAKLVIVDQLFDAGMIDKRRINEVVQWIESGGDLLRWEGAGEEAMMGRKSVLEHFYKKITDPSFQSKTQTKKRGKRFQWEPHQLFALPISDALGADCDLLGEYFLIYVIGEESFFKGRHFPYVVAKITKGGILPRNKEEFEKLSFVPFAKTKYDPHFRMFRSGQNYQLDNEGFVHEYGFSISQFRGDAPPKKLEFIGLIQDISLPQDAFWRDNSELGCQWSDLERILIQRYIAYNRT